MKYEFYTKYNEAICNQCYWDAYVKIEGKNYCWNHFLHHVSNTDKKLLTRAWERLYTIENDKFTNWVKNFKEQDVDNK